MLASMSGAGITALTMTPFDVVKGTYKFSHRYFIFLPVFLPGSLFVILSDLRAGTLIKVLTFGLR